MTSVIVAEIGAAHGLHGAVKLKLFGHGLDSFSFTTLHSDAHGDFTLKSLRSGRNDFEAIAAFAEITDRTKAETLRGVELFVARDSLPEPESDEYYHTDLIGLAVHDNKTHDLLGTVSALHNFGAGDILEFTASDGRTHMHPFDQNFVPDIDLEAGVIEISGFDPQ